MTILRSLALVGLLVLGGCASASYHPVLICEQVGPKMIACMDLKEYKALQDKNQNQ